jgi:two-component system chemotaxis sensor kinase CheA
MNTKEEEFLKRLQAMFEIEAEEHVQAISSGLIELEKNPLDKKSPGLIEIIFRAMHSLKGAARSVNRNDIESICQAAESIFSKMKNEQLVLSTEQFDLIHKAIDIISEMIPGSDKRTVTDNRELIKQLRRITVAGQPVIKEDIPQNINKSVSDNVTPITPSIEVPTAKLELTEMKPSERAEEKSRPLETVRISTAKLDPLFLQAEQMIQSKITSVQRIADLKNLSEFVSTWKNEIRKLESRHIINNEVQLKEIIRSTNENLEETERSIVNISHAIENDQRSLGRMIDDHLDSMKKVLMLPISTLIEGFPRLVRDLARDQGKKVDLIIHGEEIEVDKRILEELKDPLTHLLRNCIDHGIKNPEERLKINKSLRGTISLLFTVIDSHNLGISISDDGAGINIEKVHAAAVKSGLLSKDNIINISAQESLALIFKSGITTSPIITDISGRGLGLAIVYEKVEKLNGKITIESKPGTGTTFLIVLPMTLSTFRGVLVKTGEHLFFIPTNNVERVLGVKSEEIKTVENQETILIGQEIVGIKKLSDVLGIDDRTKVKPSQKGSIESTSNYVQLLFLKQGNKRICFKVDEIFDEHQILVKELGKQLIHIRNIGGAAVLGSGKVVPVINVSDLMKSAVGFTSAKGAVEQELAEDVKIYKILVVDDSITSRTLIKNILSSSGYDVTTAIDGVDAFTKALVGEYDLVVSDVDMPRMNGFELTAKIKKDKKLGELPVVLVTALETREDREHGIDVGADAYIIKSSFDQSNLLEVVKKLL